MRRWFVVLIGGCLFSAVVARAQEKEGVSREDFEKMKAMLNRLEMKTREQDATIGRLQRTIDGQSEQLKKHGEAQKEYSTHLDTMIEELRKGEKAALPHVEAWDDHIQLGFAATGVYQGASGAKRRFFDHRTGNYYWAPDGDVGDATLSFDFEVLATVFDHGTAFALIEAGNGDGIDANIPTLSGFNDDADNDDRLHLSELWYEQHWLDEKIRLRAGKLDLTTLFDTNQVANDETAQFLSSAFVNNVAVEWPDGDYTVGATAWVSLWEWLDLGYAVAEAHNDWDDVFDSTFHIWEIDVKPKPFGRQGNYRAYAWLNDLVHQDIKYPARWRQRGYGVGLSFDQEATDHLTLFMRYGWQRECVYEFEDAWSFGFQLKGDLWKRPTDHLGFAFGIISMGGDWKNYHERPVVDFHFRDFPEGIVPGDERHIELYYSFQAHDHLTISPHVQWVGNAMGDRQSDDVWVGGVRAQLTF
ncbi:MAG: carbohydrate porin [Planctomycetota bacterium]